MKTQRLLATLALLVGPVGAALAAGPSVSNDELLYRCRLDHDVSACEAATPAQIVETPRAAPGSYANKLMLDGSSYEEAIAQSQGLRESAQARIVDDSEHVASNSYDAYRRLQGGVFADIGYQPTPYHRFAWRSTSK